MTQESELGIGMFFVLYEVLVLYVKFCQGTFWSENVFNVE